MSYRQYEEYGGNPYTSSAPNPDARPGQNPYELTTQGQTLEAPDLTHEQSAYSQYSQEGYSSQPTHTALSLQDFLATISDIRKDINSLSTYVNQIGTLHQRALSNPDASSSAELENVVTQTQIHNTQIRNRIKSLETDANKTPDGSEKNTKFTQLGQLKRSFQEQLKGYEQEEQAYRQRYKEQIARQYKIVNPEATDAEVQEAANANWGDEGVFQTALKTNRAGAASTVLGAVRARHREIERINETLADLAALFQSLAEVVEYQEPQVKQVEMQTEHANDNLVGADKHMDSAITSAKHRNKMKRWLLFTVIAIICILALILGLYFGLRKNSSNNNNNGNNNSNDQATTTVTASSTATATAKRMMAVRF
ncbi:MAG: hypothetical protein M1834_006843 [Cirrosporium novae-zelandiae]|nr:MAG: hypothetical protein M1834_006843 [Cirrosporium novae-zelandiae]